MQTKLILYVRTGCHLCEQMQVQLVPLQQKYGFLLEVIDIETDEALKADYAERVPVLATEEKQILCDFFLDEKSLLIYLQPLNPEIE